MLHKFQLKPTSINPFITNWTGGRIPQESRNPTHFVKSGLIVLGRRVGYKDMPRKKRKGDPVDIPSTVDHLSIF